MYRMSEYTEACVCYGEGVMESGILFVKEVKAIIRGLRIDFSLSRNLVMMCSRVEIDRCLFVSCDFGV